MHTQIEAFHRPTTLAEASALLADKSAIAVAGATEVGLRVRKSVRALVDLSGLGLDGVRRPDSALHLGAMVRATRIARDPAIRAAIGDALPESALAIASEPVRNLTSLGGNVIHLTSWSDMPTALQVLDARFRVQGTRDRWYACGEFLSGQPRRLLEPGDLLTEVAIPISAEGTGSAFYKHARTAVDFALVNLAAQVTLDGETATDVRVSVGAVHTPPIRLTDAEAILVGTTLDTASLDKAAAAGSAQVRPRRDQRASEGYLRHCVGVVLRRTVCEAARRAA